jgi:hypothetical protein
LDKTESLYGAGIHCPDTEKNFADNTVAVAEEIDVAAGAAVIVADDENAVVGTAVDDDIGVKRTDADAAAAAAAAAGVAVADTDAVVDAVVAAVAATAASGAAAAAEPAAHFSVDFGYGVAVIQMNYRRQHYASHELCQQQMSAAVAAVATLQKSMLHQKLQWVKMIRIGESLANEEKLLHYQKMLWVETEMCYYLHHYHHSWVKRSVPREGCCCWSFS